LRILGRHQKIARYRRKWSSQDRADIRRRLGNKCGICGSREQLEIHHLVPLSRGGRPDIKNCILLCKECHKQVDDTLLRKGGG